jgi:hypothetical protein
MYSPDDSIDGTVDERLSAAHQPLRDENACGLFPTNKPNAVNIPFSFGMSRQIAGLSEKAGAQASDTAQPVRGRDNGTYLETGLGVVLEEGVRLNRL